MVSFDAFLVVFLWDLELQESKQETRYRPGKLKGAGSPTLVTRPHFKPWASWRSINPWSANFVRGHDSTTWIIVCRSQHWHLPEEVRHHFCRLADTTLCSYGSGSAMTMCGGEIRSPVAGQSGRIPVPCWPRLPNPKLLATSFLYQKWWSPTTVVFWNEARLVVGQTHCGLASLGGALTSLWEHQLRIFVNMLTPIFQ